MTEWYHYKCWEQCTLLLSHVLQFAEIFNKHSHWTPWSESSISRINLAIIRLKFWEVRERQQKIHHSFIIWGRQVVERDSVPPFRSDRWCRIACSHPHSQTKENSALLDTAVKGIKCGRVQQNAPTGSHRASIHHYLFAQCCQCESPLLGRQRGEDSILREDSGGERKKEEWERWHTNWTPQTVNSAGSS